MEKWVVQKGRTWTTPLSLSPSLQPPLKYPVLHPHVPQLMPRNHKSYDTLSQLNRKFTRCATATDFADASHSKSAKSVTTTVSYGIFSSENAYPCINFFITRVSVSFHPYSNFTVFFQLLLSVLPFFPKIRYNDKQNINYPCKENIAV